MMPKIETCLSPELTHLHSLETMTVVVADIFRATSCFVAGLASGAAAIRPVAEVESCLEWGKRGYLTAGERDGEKVSGFDLGNSPFDYQHPSTKGQKVCATTTNGTRAIHHAAKAPRVYIGAFLNLNALAARLADEQQDVLVLCAGWKNRFSMEDTLFAGALARKLGHSFAVDDDATLAAISLYQSANADLAEFLKSASHYRRLQKIGLEKDMVFCLDHSRFDVIPVLKNEEVIVP